MNVTNLYDHDDVSARIIGRGRVPGDKLGDAIREGRLRLHRDLITMSQIRRYTGWNKAFVEGLFITGILPGFRLFDERVAKRRHWDHVYRELRRLRAEGEGA
jgi:hypothetical protein